MKLTKLAVKKLNNAAITTRIFNGTCKEASVCIHNNGLDWILTYELSNPLLCLYEVRDQARMCWMKGSSGEYVDIPDTIQNVVDKLRNAATMDPDEAWRVKNHFLDAVEHYNKQMFGE